MNRIDPDGQHRAAGNALIGLGSAGLFVALGLGLLHRDFPFLEAGSMGLTAGLLTATGVWLKWDGVRRAKGAGRAV